MTRFAIKFIVIGLVTVVVAKADVAAKQQVDRLIAAARIYDEQEMKHAIESIVGIGRPAVSELRPALSDFDDNVRWQAIIALGRIGSPARGEVPNIVKALGDNDSDVRAAAAEALGMLAVRSVEVIGALERRLVDEHGIVRSSANWALWQLVNDTQSVTGLIKELGSSDWMVTSRATRHLAAIGEPADTYLSGYLQQTHRPGRRHAAAAIAAMNGYSKSVIPVLVNCLADNDSQVAEAASRALATSGEVAVPRLIHVLEAKSTRGKRYAIIALGYIGRSASGALPIVTQYLSSTDLAVRLAAMNAIGKIGVSSRIAECEVRKLLDDPNQDVRGAACGTLAQIGVTDAVTIAALQRVAEIDPKDFVRQAAKNALLRDRFGD